MVVNEVFVELLEEFVLPLVVVILDDADTEIGAFTKLDDDRLLSNAADTVRWFDEWSPFSLLVCCVFIIDIDFPPCKRSLDGILEDFIPSLELSSKSLVSPSWSLQGKYTAK